jgi:restriction endonuclease S subunit
MTGAANMSISLDRLASVTVEFPILAEQERIVKKLDCIDDLRDLRKQVMDRGALLAPSYFHEIFGDPEHTQF